MEQGYVRTKIRNSVAVIEFYHPKGNSLPGILLSSLASEIRAAGKNDEIRVIILQSAGERAFCAGASFDELVNIKDEQGGKVFFSGFAEVINAMRLCPRFILGRAQGKAVGGGVGLIAATDACWATSRASIRLSELSIGIGPFVIEPAVRRRIGDAAFAQLLLHPGEWMPAEWVREKGLYMELYNTVAELDAFLEEKSRELASYNPAVLTALKRSLWEGTSGWDQELIHRAAMSGRFVLSDEAQTAIQRLLNK